MSFSGVVLIKSAASADTNPPSSAPAEAVKLFKNTSAKAAGSGFMARYTASLAALASGITNSSQNATLPSGLGKFGFSP